MEVSTKSFYTFVLLWAVQYLFLLLSDHLLIDHSLYYNSLQDQLSFEKIDELVEESNAWKWVSFVILPLRTLLRCFLVSICIWLGGFLLDLEYRLATFFRIALIAEFVLLLPILIKIFWFIFIRQNYTKQDLYYFSPLSVLNFFDRNKLDKWLINPLQALNIFEFLYWLALAYQLKEVLGKNFRGSLGFVASTYGVGLLIWVVLVIFLTVSI